MGKTIRIQTRTRHRGAFVAAALGAIATLATLAGCAAMPLFASYKQLNESSFDDIRPGMSSDEVLAQLGPPTYVFGAGWTEHTHIWNYRWAGADCVWYQITIRDADRKVRESGMSPDPICDGGPHSRD